MENEIWAKTYLSENYEISNFGRVRSLDKKVKHVSGHAIKKGIIMHQFIANGYPAVSIVISPKNRKIVKVHRLLAIAFIPNPENKPQINHINGIKTDNRIENLEWATSGENVRHAWNEGLSKKRSSFIELSDFMSKLNNYIAHELIIKTPVGNGKIIIDQNNYRIQYENGQIENLVKSVRYWKERFQIYAFKLSDLDKFIPELGFVPIEELGKRRSLDWSGEKNKKPMILLIRDMKLKRIPFDMVEKLFTWHFWPFEQEYFEQGLVIDKFKQAQNG